MNAKAPLPDPALLGDDLALPSTLDAVTTPSLPASLRAIHWFIILNLVVQCAYGSWQVFVVLQPEGTFGPMWGRATDIPYELMMARRAYALESWVAFVGLALYVGVTEILPRRWQLGGGRA